MLTIEIKFIARELATGMQNGTYNVESGATVRELIEVCAKQNEVAAPLEKAYKLMHPMFNGKPVLLDSPLTENGVLHICRIIMGG